MAEASDNDAPVSDFARRERARRQARMDKWHASILLDRHASPTPERLYVELAYARSGEDIARVVRHARNRTALLVTELSRGRKKPARLPSVEGAFELVGVDLRARLTCTDESRFEASPLETVAPDPEHPVWDAVPSNATVRGGRVWTEGRDDPVARELTEIIEARRTRFRWLALVRRRAAFTSAWAWPGAKKYAIARAGLIDVFEQSDAPLSSLGLTAGLGHRVEAALDQFMRGGRTLGRLPSAWVLKAQKGIGKAAVQQIAAAMLQRTDALFGAWPEDEPEVDPALDDGLDALADLFE